MSYSFSVRAATKAEAKVQVAEKLAGVVSQFPLHVKDRDQALATAEAFIDVLPDTEERDYSVSVSGWLSAQREGGLIGASVSVSVGFIERNG